MCLFCMSCQNQNTLKPEVSGVDVKINNNLLSSQVQIDSTTYAPFKKKLILNGTILAHRKVALKFDRGGELIDFNLRNGSWVSKGETIAKLDQSELELDLRLLKAELEQATLDRDERIMLLGGEFGEDNSITADQLTYVEVKSGVKNIKERMAQIRYQIERMTSYAPFSGVMSDVLVRQHQRISVGETMATLIDPGSLEASFDILESSFSQIKKGQLINVVPLSSPDKVYVGHIARINPVVNKNGLVNVKARINGSKRALFDGMKIKVEIITETAPMVIIPKEALVIRSEREVVFTYDPAEELAKWKYVTVAHENDHELAISDGLSKDDLIIIEGNLNLDHDAKVTVATTDDVSQ